MQVWHCQENSREGDDGSLFSLPPSLDRGRQLMAQLLSNEVVPLVREAWSITSSFTVRCRHGNAEKRWQRTKVGEWVVVESRAVVKGRAVIKSRVVAESCVVAENGVVTKPLFCMTGTATPAAQERDGYAHTS